jgi:hypothetical protein
MSAMIRWVLQKLGLIAAPDVPSAVSSAIDDISEGYEFVPAPIVKKSRTSKLTEIMSHFSARPQEVPLPQPPVLRRSILEDYTKEFFNKLEKIIGNPPVNQTPPTLSDVEILLPAKKKKTFNHLKLVDAPAENRNAFSDVLSQIKAIKKSNDPNDPDNSEEEIKIAEPIEPPVKFSENRVSLRLAITQGLFQMKADHFGGVVPEQKIMNEPVIEGESAPMAPAFR